MVLKKTGIFPAFTTFTIQDLYLHKLEENIVVHNKTEKSMNSENVSKC